jgi:hypothetical protein
MMDGHYSHSGSDDKDQLFSFLLQYKSGFPACIQLFYWLKRLAYNCKLIQFLEQPKQLTS